MFVLLVVLLVRDRSVKMSAKTRPKVFLCKNSNYSEAFPAVYEKCCLSIMGCKENKMDVGFYLHDERLVIYPSEQGIKLEHPSGCSFRLLTPTDLSSIPDCYRGQGVRVAVAGLLQSSDGQVLLTRRARHMRTFPCVWVPPGGHVEQGETLNQAFLRELSEETGLSFSEENLRISTLGLWESLFPPALSMGLPSRHHIVVYFLAEAKEDHDTLQSRMKLNQDEVDAATWLDEKVAADVARSDDFGQLIKVPQRYFCATIIENSGMIQRSLPLSNLMSSLPLTGENGQELNKERLSTGTKFAIRQWLKFLYSPPAGSMKRGDSFETVFQMITKSGHQPKKSPFWGH
ncbi:nucleoside diphosphate-linked moiety X motif 17-like [Montipora capricornis]|uniref:nucleoside diphosphate-linked moiety X motif 17-like n=1 Tax=Montipora capricornis TaxID=246305 RepID=UPI0035F1D73A